MFFERRCWILIVVLQLLALSACAGDAPPPTPLPTAASTSAANHTAILTTVPLTAGPGLTASPHAGTGQASDGAPLTWLRQNAIPLILTKLDASVDDFTQLNPIIGDARIVALGESTYGARTWADIQQRIVKFAVLQKGFNIIAVDAPPSSEGWDGMIGWRNPNNLKLTSWIIDYMRHHDQGALRLEGIGLPAPWVATRRIEAYIKTVDFATYDSFQSAYTCLTQFEYQPEAYAKQSPMMQVECWTRLRAIYETLLNRREPYSEASSTADFNAIVAQAETVIHDEEVLAGGDAVRNRLMADSVRHALDRAGPGSKLLVLAHNDFTGIRAAPIKTMGALLRDEYGSQFVSVGFDFYEGSISSVQPAKFLPVPVEASTPPADSYEQLFRLADLPIMLVPLGKNLRGSAAPAWLAGPHPFRSIREVYDVSHPEQYYYPAQLSTEFDALVFIQKVCPLPNQFDTLFEPSYVDFEDRCSPDWQFGTNDPKGYEGGYDSQVAHQGLNSLYLKSTDAAAGGNAWLTQSFTPLHYRGQRMRLSAYLKTANVAGQAALALNLSDGTGRLLVSDTMQGRKISGTHDWGLYTTVLDVPDETRTLTYGLELTGRGTVWIDDLTLEIVGKDNPSTGKGH